MSTVKVIKAKSTGKVLNISKNNPAEGWLMVEAVTESYVGGRLWQNRRLGFLRSTVVALEGLDLNNQFSMLAGQGVDTADLKVLSPKGFVEGQVLPGRIVVQDSLEPIMAKNPQFGLRIPQSGTTSEISNVVRKAAEEAGLTYQQSGKDIYRKTFYSPYPEGHPKAEQDCFLSPDNLDEVNAFMKDVQSKFMAKGAGNISKDARIAELKAISKAKRTPAQQEELSELLES